MCVLFVIKIRCLNLDYKLGFIGGDATYFSFAKEK